MKKYNELKAVPMVRTFKTAKDQAEFYLQREFSMVSMELLSSAISHDTNGSTVLYDTICIPSQDVLLDEFHSDNPDEIDSNEYSREFKRWKDEFRDKWYPLHGTLFNANSYGLFGSNIGKFEVDQDKIDELYKIGLGVIHYDGEIYLFIPGAGYDFFEAHWIPLFSEFLHWITYENEVKP